MSLHESALFRHLPKLIPSEAHQRVNLGLASFQVISAQGKHRQLLNTQLQAPFHSIFELLQAETMPLVLLHVLLGRKSPIAVHDYSYRTRYLASFEDLDEEPLVPSHWHCVFRCLLII